MAEKIVKDSQGLAKELVNGVKEFEELKVIDLNGRPYYSIIYLENGNEFEGYASYNLKVISEYLKRHFGFAQPETHDKRTEKHACDLISRQMLLEYIHGEPVGKLLCDKYNLDGLIEQFPSAQPYTDEEIQKMQDIEQAQLDKAYEMGKADALRWIPCNERLPEINQTVLLSTTDGEVIVGYRYNPDIVWQVTANDGRKIWVYDPENYPGNIDELPKAETCGFEDRDNCWLSVTSINYDLKFAGISAWMSLPEPYKGDDK